MAPKGPLFKVARAAAEMQIVWEHSSLLAVPFRLSPNNRNAFLKLKIQLIDRTTSSDVLGGRAVRANLRPWLSIPVVGRG